MNSFPKDFNSSVFAICYLREKIYNLINYASCTPVIYIDKKVFRTIKLANASIEKQNLDIISKELTDRGFICVSKLVEDDIYDDQLIWHFIINDK